MPPTVARRRHRRDAPPPVPDRYPRTTRAGRALEKAGAIQKIETYDIEWSYGQFKFKKPNDHRRPRRPARRRPACATSRGLALPMRDRNDSNQANRDRSRADRRRPRTQAFGAATGRRPHRRPPELADAINAWATRAENGAA